MITIARKKLEQVLEALDLAQALLEYAKSNHHPKVLAAYNFLREALAQPAQEPDELTIAYMSGLYDGKKKRPWVGLTDTEWMNIVNKDRAWFDQRPAEVANEVAKLVTAKLKEKNT